MDGATRGGTAEPTSREQNTRQEEGWGRTEIEKGRKEKHLGKFWRANDGGEVEQRGAASNRAKGGIEHVREDGRSQLPRTTFGRWRWMGHTELDGRWTF